MMMVEGYLRKAFPILWLNKDARRLLAIKPKGVHPIKKMVWRKGCRELVKTYHTLESGKQAGRLVGNKNLSGFTKKAIEQLKNQY